MKLWQWFTQNGDHLCHFVSLSALSLQSVDGLSPHMTSLLTVAGIIAASAHRSFFVRQPRGEM